MTKTIVEEANDVLVENKKPLCKAAPGAPFIVVALNYLVVLSLALGSIGLAVWIL